MNQHWELDSSAIRRELGYSEIFSPDEALASTIEWERANPPQDEKSAALSSEEEDELISRWQSAQGQPAILAPAG
jgi:hypothetical protein